MPPKKSPKQSHKKEKLVKCLERGCKGVAVIFIDKKKTEGYCKDHEYEDESEDESEYDSEDESNEDSDYDSDED